MEISQFFEELLVSDAPIEVDAESTASEVQIHDLPLLESLLVQHILQKTINELLILNRGYCEKDGAASGDSAKNKNRAVLKNKLYKLSQQMHDNPLKMLDIKIGNDINYARQILADTLDNIKTDGHFNALHVAVNKNAQVEASEFNLIRLFVLSKKTAKILQSKLKNEAQESEMLMKELNERIAILDDQIHDLKVVNREKIALVENWETSRLEQQKIKIENERFALTNEHMSIKDKIETEKRAIDDITNYMKYKIEYIDNLTAEWIKRYDNEIEYLDDNLQLTREKITDMKLKHAELKEVYETREKEMFDYWEAKRIAEEVRLLEELMLRSAIKIQAWWRGTMVRRCLGPFRKSKKGKGKGNKKRR